MNELRGDISGSGVSAGSLPGPVWVKSSYSGPTGGNCLELAHLPGGQVAVRHSRHPDGPVLIFSPDEWAAFLTGAKDGEFDQSLAHWSELQAAWTLHCLNSMLADAALVKIRAA